MKKLLGISAALLCVLAFSTASQAQILWGSAQNMVTDTDVLTNGTYVDAAAFFGSDSVNGVTFNPITSGTDGLGIAITTPNGTTGSAPFGSPSTSYNNLVSVIGFGFFNNGTVTLTGLTAGHTYQVQAWTYFGGGSGFGTTIYDSSPSLDSNTGQFVVGTLTLASGNSATFNYNTGSGNYAMIDAVSIRDVTSAPEPSEALLMGVGLLGLVVLARRKRVASL